MKSSGPRLKLFLQRWLSGAVIRRSLVPVVTATQEGRRRSNGLGWLVGSSEVVDRCLGPKGFKLRLQLKQKPGCGRSSGMQWRRSYMEV